LRRGEYSTVAELERDNRGTREVIMLRPTRLPAEVYARNRPVHTSKLDVKQDKLHYLTWSALGRFHEVTKIIMGRVDKTL
jgi:hypothetical protein